MERKRINHSAQTLHKQVNYLKTFFRTNIFQLAANFVPAASHTKKQKKKKKKRERNVHSHNIFVH